MNGLPLCDRLTLRLAEVAAVTGLSESMVRKQVAAGVLPVVRVGTVPLVRTADLRAFLEAHVEDRQATADRIAAEIAATLQAQAG